MKERRILFPFDDKERAKEIISEIGDIVGKENVSVITDGQHVQCCIRCKKKIWKEIVFLYDLVRYYVF